MDFSGNITLTGRLDALTEALDGSGDDLGTILAVLVEDVTAAISSFIGLMITVTVQDQPVTVAAMNSHIAATSMLLPSPTAPGDHLVFYAANPGAFVDLARDAQLTPASKGRW